MSDILANEGDRDIVIINGDLDRVDGIDAIAQRLRLKLLTFQGEWFLNLAFGVPWYARVLGQKFNAGQTQTTVNDAILSTPGVVEIITITVQRTGSERRTATINVKVLTTLGVPTTVEVTVP